MTIENIRPNTDSTRYAVICKYSWWLKRLIAKDNESDNNDKANNNDDNDENDNYNNANKGNR